MLGLGLGGRGSGAALEDEAPFPPLTLALVADVCFGGWWLVVLRCE